MSTSSSENESFTNFPSSPPSPPPTPPSLRFCPPLFLQRRSKVHDILRTYSSDCQPLYSLLDVGCGFDIELLRSLTPCDDDLPLSIITGIDLDHELFGAGMENMSVIEDTNVRWRELTTSLVHGSFEALSPNVIGQYDAITACEVIEHLDPVPLSNFLPITLGRMKPNILIVTTPNRDFNRLFEMPVAPLTNGEESFRWTYDPFTDPETAGRRHYRSPHLYAMRHHDHRFEFTRNEFMAWAEDGADKHGYAVAFVGCGTLAKDCFFEGEDWAINEAVQRELKSSGSPSNLSIDDATQLVFGKCTQIAVFVRKDSNAEDCVYLRNEADREIPLPLRDISNLFFSGLRFVGDRVYEKHEEGDTNWPPQLVDFVQDFDFPAQYLLPNDILRGWEREWFKKDLSLQHQAQPSKVVIKSDIRAIWNNSYKIQGRFRYNYSLFVKTMMNVTRDKAATGRFSPFNHYGQYKQISTAIIQAKGKEITLSLIKSTDGYKEKQCAVKLDPLYSADENIPYALPPQTRLSRTTSRIYPDYLDPPSPPEYSSSGNEDVYTTPHINTSNVTFNIEDCSTSHNNQPYYAAGRIRQNLHSGSSALVARQSCSIDQDSQSSESEDDDWDAKSSKALVSVVKIPSLLDYMPCQLSWSLDPFNSRLPLEPGNNDHEVGYEIVLVDYSVKESEASHPINITFWQPKMSDELAHDLTLMGMSYDPKADDSSEDNDDDCGFDNANEPSDGSNINGQIYVHPGWDINAGWDEVSVASHGW